MKIIELFDYMSSSATSVSQKNSSKSNLNKVKKLKFSFHVRKRLKLQIKKNIRIFLIKQFNVFKQFQKNDKKIRETAFLRTRSRKKNRNFEKIEKIET